MIDLETIRLMLEYTDVSSRALLEHAGGVSDVQLDRELEIGPGTLRKILLHTYNGEAVWLKRWQGNAETKWPDESEKVSVQDLVDRFERVWLERDRYFTTVVPMDLVVEQAYRDSKGSMYKASLGEMFLQGVLHTKHHQAQACNALRRVGSSCPELDYMYRVRRPA
jgi:uncharacterized damage-inducible protein DinB